LEASTSSSIAASFVRWSVLSSSGRSVSSAGEKYGKGPARTGAEVLSLGGSAGGGITEW
jgi:hypothetical protein